MSTCAAVARYNRQMQTFEYMQRKLLTVIDHRSKRKAKPDCNDTCKAYKELGMDACLGCSGKLN